jgi:hypothetical protein
VSDRICSVMVAASSSMLSREIDLRMYNALQSLLAGLRLKVASRMMNSYHMTCQRVVA